MAASKAYDIPLLTAGDPNNLFQFRESVIQELTIDFPDHSDFLNTLKLPLMKGQTAEELIARGVPADQTASLSAKSWEKALDLDSKMKVQIKAMYFIIWKHLSPDSKALIQQRSDDYAIKSMALDAVWLWKSVLSTHYPGASYGTVDERKLACQTSVLSLVMGPAQALVDFKKLFDFHRTCLISMGATDYSDAQAALIFLKALDSRYDACRNRIRTDMRNGRIDQGAMTLAYVFREAQAEIVPTVAAIVNAASFATTGAKALIEAPAAHGIPATGHLPDEQWRVLTREQQQARKKLHGDAKRARAARSEVQTKSNNECVLCGKGNHEISKCFQLAKAKKLLSGSVSDKFLKSGKMNHTKEDSEASDADDEDASGRVPTFIKGFMNLTKNTQNSQYEVLLDTGADISIIHKDLLTDIHPSEKPLQIQTVGGHALTARMQGMLKNFFMCYTSKDAKANVLCFADVADKYEVDYDPNEDSFNVHLPDKKLKFIKKGKLYSAQMDEWISDIKSSAILHVTAPNGMRYTKKEIAMAQQAYQFLESACFPSQEQAIELTTGGYIRSIPFTKKDLMRAYEIFGEPAARTKGNMTNRQAGATESDYNRKLLAEPQTLFSDVLTIAHHDFLLTLAHPLQLTIITELPNLEMATCIQHMQMHVNILRGERYDVQEIVTDRATSFNLFDGNFPNISVKKSGAGDHVPRADERCKMIKNMFVSLQASLPFSIPDKLIGHAVTYVTMRLNMQRGRNMTAPPRVEATGYKPSFDKEYNISFGKNCEVHNSNITSKHSQPNTRSCIALWPVGNRQGSWTFWNLATEKTVVSSHWQKYPHLPTPIIEQLKQMKQPTAKRLQEKFKTEKLEQKTAKDLKSEVIDQSNSEIKSEVLCQPEAMVKSNATSVQTVVNIPDFSLPMISPEAHDMQLVIQNLQNSSIPEAGDRTATSSRLIVPISESTPNLQIAEKLQEIELLPEKRVRKKSAIAVRAAEYAINQAAYDAKMKKGNSKLTIGNAYLSFAKGLRQFGGLAQDAAKKELNSLIAQKVFKYCHETNGQTALWSQMMINEKLDANGKVTKVKARLCANGKSQKMMPFQSTTSPTVNYSSVLSILKIAAVEKRSIRVLDFITAYLHAPIDAETYMILSQPIATLLLALDPLCLPYLRSDGTLLVQLQKALYGLKQSGKLWNDLLVGFLRDLGFIQNPRDMMVFNLNKNGTQITICFHVDDGLMTCCDETNLQWLSDSITERFKKITEQTGRDLQFIGINIKRNLDGTIDLSMPKLVQEITIHAQKAATTPANPNLFATDGDRTLLSTKAQEIFHSLVAQIQYLALHVRPDILLPSAILTRHVLHPTVSDKAKLQRIIDYLARSSNETMHISTEPISGLYAFVDASFAGHFDFRSHTGAVVTIGDTLVIAKSKKQNMNALNSTQAEMIALTDQLQTILNMGSFLQYQGFNLPAPTIFQDNTAVIQMTTEKAKLQQNKHMAVRQIDVSEKVKSGEIVIRYIRTAEMLADGLTKPLQGALFQQFKQRILGNETTRGKEVRSTVISSDTVLPYRNT